MENNNGLVRSLKGSKEYQQCVRCVMDTSDKEIIFSEYGVCSHCINFDQVSSKKWHPNEKGQDIFDQTISKIKENGKGKDYDCIIGLSGGLDSSYLAYIVSKTGLRILAVHVDAGWNSELAVQNIENIVKKCGIDLFTHVVDWEAMQDLQYAFFRAQLPNQDIPQDHAFFAALYSYATKHNIEYVLHGSNIATESVLPKSWGYNAMDARHIKSVHKAFGKRKLKNFPLVGFAKLNVYYPFVKRMKVTKLLNFIPYNVQNAIQKLQEEVDYKYYGGKHHESRFTKFFQSYYLPHKFGFDKRKAHLSSLILSGQKTRDQALESLLQPLYSESELEADIEYFIKKIAITDIEYEKLMSGPVRSHHEFGSNARLFNLYYKTAKEFKYLVPKKFRTSIG